MKQLILVTLIGVTLLGCKNESGSCGSVFFGGEIINPNSDNVVIFDANDKPVDTLYLDENNRFLHTIENLNSGLHSFRHGGEYQIMVLEPSDSVMIRLNTLDFDESLVFSGNGSRKNNYLISLFLELEAENESMYNLSKKKPEVFKSYIDSIKVKKYAKLTKFSEKHKTSNLFNTVAKASIDYHYYAHHEVYPFRHFGKEHLTERDNLPSDFYAYRKDINYDMDELKVFNPYTNFLYPHINNLALDRYYKISGDSIFNANSVHYNLTKLHLIDSLIGNESIRNHMLRFVTRNYLTFNAGELSSKEVYDSYMAKNSNSDYAKYIENLYASLAKLLPGNRFPEIEVINHKNKVENINSIIERPTVIYFWSSASKNHFKESHHRVKELKETHPNVDFISVNINSNNLSVWKRMLRQYNFALDHEFRFRDPSAAKKILALNNLYKVMIVDSDKNIIANTRMFSQEFKDALEKLDTRSLN